MRSSMRTRIPVGAIPGSSRSSFNAAMVPSKFAWCKRVAFRTLRNENALSDGMARATTSHKEESRLRSSSKKKPRKQYPDKDAIKAPNIHSRESKYDMLIVVEGINDMKAVRRAMRNADVFVLGTATRAGDHQVQSQIRELSSRYSGVVLLLDPDVAGRQARNVLNRAFGGCFHAFVPCMAATARTNIRMKQAGDIGIEHAQPESIRYALKHRKYSVIGRSFFDREELQTWGLVAEKMGQRGGDVTERRRLVCDYLGLGMCDGRQLLRQLNEYGFEKGDLMLALKWTENKLRSRNVDSPA